MDSLGFIHILHNQTETPQKKDLETPKPLNLTHPFVCQNINNYEMNLPSKRLCIFTNISLVETS